MIKKLSMAAMAFTLMVALSACGSSSYTSKESSDTGQSSAVASSSSDGNQDESSPASTDTTDQEQLRDALEAKIGNSIFYKSVRNDKTGNWRELVYYSNVEPQNFASDYYTAYFESDSEVHAIVNLGLKTTANVTLVGNDLMIDVHEYVDGEEHDATVLFSGDLIAQYSVDKNTGEIEKLS